MIVAINYGSEGWEKAQRLNSIMAKKQGADAVIEYSPKDIDSEFYKKNAQIFAVQRGGGYWIWKPYIIADALKRVKDGDYVVYTDSGSVLLHDIHIFTNIMERDHTDVMCFAIGEMEYKWTKRDAFILMDMDREDVAMSNQICAGYIIVRKTASSVALVNEFLEYSQDMRIVSDDENVLGKDNYDGFEESRHDQTAWSLLCKKHGIKPYRDPSQYGFTALPKEILDRSTYPQMIDSHRKPFIGRSFELPSLRKWYHYPVMLFYPTTSPVVWFSKKVYRKGISFFRRRIERPVILAFRKFAIGDKAEYSIIANNCCGADISKKIGLPFLSPTVNLQIIPRQYCDFITNLKHYLSVDLEEVTNFTEEQRRDIHDVYSGYPEDLGFPFGILDNRILVCFQHYKTFSEAKEAWNRRKSRVNYEKLAFVYATDSPYGWGYAEEFYKIDLPNKLLILVSPDGKDTHRLESKDSARVVTVKCPSNRHFMNETRFMKAYYEKDFSGWKWMRTLRKIEG